MKLESKVDTLMKLLQGRDDPRIGKIAVKEEEQEFVVRLQPCTNTEADVISTQCLFRLMVSIFCVYQPRM